MSYKFDGQKYVTKGITETLSPDVQLFLFMCVEIMHGKTAGQLDYLQVFKIDTSGEGDSRMLHIRHEQEQPDTKMDYVLPVNEEINCKVYIIDDIDHVTMLLAEEY